MTYKGRVSLKRKESQTVRRLTSILLIPALIGVIASPLSQVAAAQAGAKTYKGTITLKRTNKEPDNNLNESAQFASVTLAPRGESADRSTWMNNDPPMVTVAVNNVNQENPSISIPSRQFKPEKIGVTLTIQKTRKAYSLIVGPIDRIPASITAGGQKINDFWSVQGQSAEDIPLPADPTHLKGSKTIKETNGATVELSWDLQLS